MATPARRSLTERMLGAAKLDKSTYEEVEADKSATVQAASVVVMVAVATGIASLGTAGLPGLFFGIVSGLIGWAIWAWVTYFVGTKLFATAETHANWGQMARTLGFAQSPGVLKVLAIIPAIGGLIFFIVSIWQLVAMVTAVRQALDYTSTWRAAGVVVVGMIPYAILLSIVFARL